MTAIKQSLSSLTHQVRGNPRLKAGLALIVCILLFLGWDSLHDWRLTQQKNAIDKELNLKRTRALRGQDEWLERATQAEQRLKALRGQLPAASTAGLAQAGVQNWLAMLTGNLPQKANVSIDVMPAAKLEEGVEIWRVKARISAEISPRQAFDLIQKVEDSDNLAIVESAQIRSGNGQRSSLSIASFYQISAAAEQAQAPAVLGESIP